MRTMGRTASNGMDLIIGNRASVETAHAGDRPYTLGKIGTVIDINFEFDSILIVLDVGDSHGDTFWFPRKNLGPKACPREGPEGLR